MFLSDFISVGSVFCVLIPYPKFEVDLGDLNKSLKIDGIALIHFILIITYPMFVDLFILLRTHISKVTNS